MESKELAQREDEGKTLKVSCECEQNEVLPYLPLLTLDENGHLVPKTFEQIWNLKTS